jgi:hypothetical protein
MYKNGIVAAHNINAIDMKMDETEIEGNKRRKLQLGMI